MAALKIGAAGSVASETRLRVDAQRSADALVQAARKLFATHGVEVSTREIAAAAGVGMGTLYRRFPRRADLIGAVFASELDKLADAAEQLSGELTAFEALSRWMQMYADLLATKRGLAKAISSDDPVYVGIAATFDQRLLASAERLYDAALRAGELTGDLDAGEVLSAVSALCMAAPEGRSGTVTGFVATFLRGLSQIR